MTLGQWIKNYRAENRMSMQEFADRCGFSKAYIGQLEKGLNPKTGRPISPTMATLSKIAAGVGMDLDIFLKKLDADTPISLRTVPAPVSRVPILGRVVAGQPLGEEEYIDGWLNLNLPPDCYALRIHGNSMEPTIMDGDVAIVQKTEDIDSGDVAIVTIDGSESTVKQVKKTPQGIMLVGFNTAAFSPRFFSNQEIESLPVRISGKVVRLIREM